MVIHIYIVKFNRILLCTNKIENCSFLVENDNTFVAAVVLAINRSEKFLFYGYDFGYCPSPIFLKKLKPSQKENF